MSIYVAPKPAAKALTGPGAGAMQTLPVASWLTGQQSPQKFMKAAAGFWRSDPWIRSAERVISGKFSTVEWHLEDDADVEIDDAYPDPKYLVPWELLEQPQAKLQPEDRQVNASTRRELWAITARHMGVCGSSFWFLDQLEPTAKTPLALLYIAPWRMWPSFTKQGNLTGWVLDWNENTQQGTPLSLDQVVQFSLEPPDEGAFAPGLVQSAMQIAQLDSKAIGHASDVLTAGGRLAGIVSPKTPEAALPDDKFEQLVRDFRTINEMPDAARRTNILQGPIDFTRTAATLTELELIALMAAMRDDILALWGVPFTQLGGSAGGSGLNSGDIRKYDEAALWQNAIHQRLVPFTEKIQYHLLDRYKDLGIDVELEIDEPEFDDDGPRFDLLQKSAGLPMRNVERRALIGLEPFNDPLLDNAIYMPINLSQVAVAPDENGNPVPEAALGRTGLDQQQAQADTAAMVPTVTPVARLALPSGINAQPAQSKASLGPRATRLHASLTRLRSRMEKEHTDTLKASLHGFLTAQRQDIAARLRVNSDHIAAKPSDIAAWWAKDRWNRELTGILARPLTAMAQNVNEHIASIIPPVPATGKATPVGVIDRALSRGAARVTNINERTRTAVQAYLVKGLNDGLSPATLADEIEAGVVLDNGAAAFDEYRAELIARTELMDAYNGAAIASFSDAGVTQLQAIDGTGDEECADRDGQIFDVSEADAIEDHPNGTLDWVPAEEEVVVEAKAETPQIVVNVPQQGIPMRTLVERDPMTGKVIGFRDVYDAN